MGKFETLIIQAEQLDPVFVYIQILELYQSTIGQNKMDKSQIEELLGNDVIKGLIELGILELTDNKKQYKYTENIALYNSVKEKLKEADEKKDLNEKEQCYMNALKYLNEFIENNPQYYSYFLTDVDILKKLFEYLINNRNYEFAEGLCEKYKSSKNKNVKKYAEQYSLVLEELEKLPTDVKINVVGIIFGGNEESLNNDQQFEELLKKLVSNNLYLTASFICEKYKESKNENIQKDSLYYLYLLSFLADLPKTIKDIIKEIKPENIWKETNQANLNRSRTYALKNNFPFASNFFHISENKSTIENILLTKVVDLEQQQRKELLEKIYYKDYKEAKEYIINRRNKHRIGIQEEYCLKLINMIDELGEEDKELSNKGHYQNNNVFEAIDAGDFKKALEITKSYHKEKLEKIAEKDPKNQERYKAIINGEISYISLEEYLLSSPLYILLLRIVKMIDSQYRGNPSKKK